MPLYCMLTQLGLRVTRQESLAHQEADLEEDRCATLEN